MFNRHDRIYYTYRFGGREERVYGTVTRCDGGKVWANWGQDECRHGWMPVKDVVLAKRAHGPCPMEVNNVN